MADQDTFGETLVALRAARTQGLIAGAMWGIMPPIIKSGWTFKPHYTTDQNLTHTPIAGRRYYIPIFLPRIETWAGFKTFNLGTGDNGDGP